KRQFDPAIASYRKAITLEPNFVEAHNNLGVALRNNEQFAQAVAIFRKTVELDPELPEAHYNLGNALADNHQHDEAFAAFRQAISLRPNFTSAHNNLGNILAANGQLDDAFVHMRQALALNPDTDETYSNLVFLLHYHPAYDARAILAELRLWNQRYAEPLRKFIPIHSNDRNPDRRLRIGYVSPDFRNHCQSFFTLPLFRHHHHEWFEIYLYSGAIRPDEITGKIREHADVWRDTAGFSDQRLAEQIQQDRIDILVDLNMHMAKGRPTLFARKPAPIQVAWLAYPGSTGLAAMDYRLTDPHLDPPGQFDDCYAEKSIRLPETFWCYAPAKNPPDVNPLPALTSNHITFGCLNNFCKVNDQVLELWSAVMRRVPNSRLILLVPKGSARRRVEELFHRQQITPDRLELIDRTPREKYLLVYHRIDIGLDTFPYNGHTTSLDSLWMGVPVITLEGKTVVGRAGCSQLTNLNLPELIAKTSEEYIQIVANLAGDIPRLSHLRQTLRQRMQNSPLCDAEKFTLGVESAYRQMWLTWCQS
ncbi:MAG: tetratricopeptide repeat protein, partial [Tepidisphaeraceae bacterium]